MCVNSTTINKWIEAKKALDSAKKLELQLRNKIVEDAKERNPDVIEGTVHTEFPNGLTVTVVMKTSKSVDREALDSIWDDLNADEQAVFDFKPSLVASTYKLVSSSETLAQVITTKPAQASVSFKQIEV